jgi:hypothetical protein
MGGSTMARPKKATQSASSDQKTIAMRTSGAYAAWIERLASFNRSTTAGLLDQALVKFAREIGFEEKAPER